MIQRDQSPGLRPVTDDLIDVEKSINSAWRFSDLVFSAMQLESLTGTRDKLRLRKLHEEACLRVLGSYLSMLNGEGRTVDFLGHVPAWKAAK